MSLTVATSTVGRFEKLKQCVESIQSGTKSPDEFLLLDNTPDGEAGHLMSNYDIEVIHESKQMGPSAARAKISEYVETEYLLFVDADVVAGSTAVERLFSRIQNSPYRATAAIWIEENSYYNPVGHTFHFDHSGENVLKEPISYDDVRDFETLEVMSSTPLLMVETDLLDVVQFDSEYRFFYEWWDFFMQFHDIGERILVDLNAEFKHFPGGYSEDQSTRQGDYDGDDDKEYFIKKWDYKPFTPQTSDGAYNPTYHNRILDNALSLINKGQKRKL